MVDATPKPHAWRHVCLLRSSPAALFTPSDLVVLTMFALLPRRSRTGFMLPSERLLQTPLLNHGTIQAPSLSSRALVDRSMHSSRHRISTSAFHPSCSSRVFLFPSDLVLAIKVTLLIHPIASSRSILSLPTILAIHQSTRHCNLYSSPSRS